MDKCENTSGYSIKLDLDSLIRDLIRSLPVMLILSVIIAMIVLLVSIFAHSPQYESDTTFVVTTKGSVAYVNNNISTTQNMAKVFPEIIKSTSLQKIVAEEYEGSLSGVSIDAQVITDTNLLNLSVVAPDPVTAYSVSKIIIDNYDRISDYIYSNAVLDVLSPPVVAVTESSPIDKKGILAKAFAMALLILAVTVAAMSYLRDTVKSESDIEEKLECSLLATVGRERIKRADDQESGGAKTIVSDLAYMLKEPEIREGEDIPYTHLITDVNVSFGFVEAFKRIRSRIENFNKDGDKNVIAITSTMESEGKSTVAANIALALSRSHENVVLIDADLRRPVQFKIFGCSDEDRIGLGTYLSGKNIKAKSMIKPDEKAGISIAMENVSFDDSSELLSSDKMKKLIKTYKEKADYVIIDTPPVLQASDAEIICTYVDGVILVAGQDIALVPDINDALAVLSSHKAEMVGCVYNMAWLGWFGSIVNTKYGYGYGYGYGKHGGYYGYGYGKHGGYYGYGYGNTEAYGRRPGEKKSYGYGYGNRKKLENRELEEENEE